MRMLFAVVAMAALVAACSGPDEVNCEDEDARALAVSFPTASEGVVPFREGGEVAVLVQANTCGVAGPAGGVVFVTSGNEVGAEVQQHELSLDVPLDSSAPHERAEKRLFKFPSGGPVTVRAQAFGLAHSAAVEVVRPALALRTTGVQSNGTERILTVCFESNAVSGVVVARLTPVGVSPAPPVARARLRTGSCAGGGDDNSTFAVVSIVVPSASVWVDAELEGVKVARISELVDTSMETP